MQSILYVSLLLKLGNVCVCVCDIYIYIYIIQARFASLACAARLADTLCPPEAPFGRLGSHWLIISEITSLNTSVLLLESISHEKSPNLSIFKILMVMMTS